MTKPSTLNLLFLDLETTGLDPDKCQIIECAAVLNGVTVVDCLTHDPVAAHGEVHWEPVAHEMHAKSGLLELWETLSSVSLSYVEDKILAAIEPYGPKGVRLAGNSIHFDRSFIKVHMPRLDAALHHRHMDVSCLMAFFEEHAALPRTPANDHRAMADVKSSMAAYERLVKWTACRAVPDAGGA